jgi:quercetin dioxygenase-like cupin family protein
MKAVSFIHWSVKMAVIVQAQEVTILRQGEGWQEVGLADAATFGAPAMIARRWLFEPGAIGPELEHGRTDQLLYVIRGSGTAEVDGQSLPLSEESVLWLEPGERYQFAAGEDGLEILQGVVDDGI